MLQHDGDIWQEVWNAILQRGPETAVGTKVKSHTTIADIERGITTRDHKEGNDNADTQAKQRAYSDNKSFAEVANWAHYRTCKYIAFLKSVHTDRNTLRLGTFKIQGINSLIQLILFGNLTWLHWEEFQLIERVYLGIFCMMQILTIKFIRKQQVKGENSTYIEQ